MSRVDKIVPRLKQPEYYSDFSMNMDKNLITGQLARIINAEAVKQSIVNLVLTDPKDRTYQPHIGSHIKHSLFDNIDDDMTIDNIKSSITNCIENNDQRAKILDIRVQADNDRNGYNVEVVFSIINIIEPQIAEIFLTRVR